MNSEGTNQKNAGPADGNYESLKLAAKQMISSGSIVGLNPHKVLRLCAEFEELKKNSKPSEGAKLKRQAIKNIVLLTAYIDGDGTVWGHDTAIDHIDNLIDQGLTLLKEKPELSETHVIDGEQATAPVQEQMLSEGTRRRVIRSLSWMIEDMKHRSDDCKGNLDNGSQGGYSPELTEAGELLDELKKGKPGTQRGTGGRRHAGNTLEAAYKQGFEDAKKVILKEVQKLGKRD